MIYRGLPGSGKTTFARAELTRRPLGTVMRVNRDDYRRMALGNRYRVPQPGVEELVTTAQHAAIHALLLRGVDVICDDTNLYLDHVRALTNLAIRAGAAWRIQDFTGVPLEVCIARDATRPAEERVGEEVIQRMYDRHVNPVAQGHRV